MPEQGYDKLYYSIGEVAEMLDVNTSLIRYWEKEFGNLRPRKTRSGNRTFSVKDIETLKYIYFLVKVRGLTLEGAKKVLKEKDPEQSSNYQTLKTLENVRKFLTELRNEI